MQTQQQARKLLCRYRELRFLELDKMPASDREIFHRGLRIEAYFTQPFLITEAFTKKKGISVSLENTISDVNRIIKGEFDDIKIESLIYIEKLEERK